MIWKYHSHTLQTHHQYREEEPHNTNSQLINPQFFNTAYILLS